MSVRTHAPHCAKTRALIESEEDSTERRHVECTCGATYGPGVEAQRETAGRRLVLALNAVRWARDLPDVSAPDIWHCIKGALLADGMDESAIDLEAGR
jgi:hypothetical protein